MPQSFLPAASWATLIPIETSKMHLLIDIKFLCLCLSVDEFKRESIAHLVQNRLQFVEFQLYKL